MQFQISGSYGLILLCILAGIAYSWLLYRKNSQSNLKKIAAVTRAILVALLAFFLLDPVLISTHKRTEKPKIVLLLDHSESILNGEKNPREFLDKWHKLGEKIKGDNEVEYLSFAGKTYSGDSSRFDGKRTDISQAIDYINDIYGKSNIGAVVLASDGAFNRGIHPQYKEFNQSLTLYTLGLGDSTIKRDLILKSVNSNAIAYLNNEFPLEINLAAIEFSGKNAQLDIIHEGKSILTKTIPIHSDQFFSSLSVNIPAVQAGVMHLKAVLTPLDGEFTTKNNRMDIFVDVIDGREKVLMVYQGPHPDIGAIKEAISQNKNYEVISKPYTQIQDADLKECSMIILHQIPGFNTNSGGILEKLNAANKPIWCITGSASHIDYLQKLSPLARIDRNQNRMNESQAIVNPAFNSFTLEPKTIETLSVCPPLKSPYGIYRGQSDLNTLLNQRVSGVATEYPLLSFSDVNGKKMAFLFGEGLWKWRMNDFALNESHNAFNELIGKIVQYLTVKEDKRKFRAYPARNTLDEDESIRFFAEVYNASYEPVNTDEVKLQLINADEKVFDFTFSPSGKIYKLDMGMLAPGTYRYVATNSNTQKSIKGSMIVKPLQTEQLDTRADFGLLRDLSRKNNGQFFTSSELDKLTQVLNSNEDITSRSFMEKFPDELINKKWIFFLALFLISFEWFIRKYEGGI